MSSSAYIRPDNVAASSVASDTSMMQQAWNIALYQFNRRREPEGPDGPDGPRQRTRRDHLPEHEARGADLAITSAIDAHIETAKASQGQHDDRSLTAQLKTANGPLMARRDQQDPSGTEIHVRPTR